MEHKRRTDENNEDISDMIRQEDDPKNRALLIILQNINLSLIANTKTVNDIDEQLNKHMELYNKRIEAEDALYNKGRGAWKVVSWIFGVIQAFLIAIVVHANTQLDKYQTAQRQLENRVTVLEQRK